MSDAPKIVAIIGAGPAGLMAAEVLSSRAPSSAGAPLQVHVYDAMPSVGRKFLLAGKGGLNLTHAEPAEPFASRYGAQRAHIEPLLQSFGAQQVRDWAQGLDIETFIGSSQRVFPTDMKAAPLLRAWLHRLREAGVVFHARHRWTGWATDSTAPGALQFATPQGLVQVQADACVLALGGASWPRLGSDGAWVAPLQARGVALAPLLPSNCGFDVTVNARIGWSEHLRSKFAGQPVKPVALHFQIPAAETTDTATTPAQFARQGEFVVTETGIEGSLVYAASSLLRDEIARSGSATIHLDLQPARSLAQVQAEVAHPRGARSLSSHLHSRLGLHGLKMALLHECLPKAAFNDPVALAQCIKALPLTLCATRPIAEAISSAGGVQFSGLSEGLMLQKIPGVFCAGEMLDWEAPTGGYLLTACMASGRAAAFGIQKWLEGA